MASCKSVITSALSKLGIASYLKPPRPEHLDVGLQRLISLYEHFIASGLLGEAHSVTPQGDTYVCRENQRVYRRGDVAQVILLPDLIEEHNPNVVYSRSYDSRLTHQPRAPRNGAFVVISDQTAGTTAAFIYEAMTAKWVSILDLTLAVNASNTDANGNVISITQESSAPLSMMGDAGLASVLAVYMADDFGQTPSSVTVRNAQDWQNSLAVGFGDVDIPIRYEYF